MSEAAKVMSAIEAVVKGLAPLESPERHRAIQAALLVLGETSADNSPKKTHLTEEQTDIGKTPSRTRQWISQNSLSSDQLQHVFDISDGATSVIAAEVLGKNNAEKTIKAYILTGIASFLATGEPAFNDKAARELCESLGCYDGSNHARYLKEKGNNFTGSKDSGWKLTAPGLKFGAAVVKELSGT